LWRARDQPSGIASRFADTSSTRSRFRNHKADGALEELVGCVRDRLQDAPSEMVFPRIDGLALYPEPLFPSAQFRSVVFSRLTAKESSFWLKSDYVPDRKCSRLGTAFVLLHARSRPAGCSKHGNARCSTPLGRHQPMSAAHLR